MQKQTDNSIDRATLATGLLLAVMYVAWLWVMPFTTKGEPREAVVALSMIAQHNWVLPTSIGADIPYKPPMLAWLVAAISAATGGSVTEFTSRLPSAIALIVTCLALLRLVARRRTMEEALLTVAIFATSMEVFRAATVCRVDMVLTMFMVLAILELHRQDERSPGTWAPSLGAALLMSGAVLTKGPVGMLLPCGIAGIYRLLKGENLVKIVVSLAATGVLSLVLPALWYAAAYAQGGERFLQLVMEENLGRMSGTMTYESHLNPWYYNVLTLVAGLAPVTLFVIFAPFAAKYRGKEEIKKGKRKGTPGSADGKGLWSRFLRGWEDWKQMDGVGRLALVAACVVFLFYCFPASKRSVYLLPMYPFVALWIARLALRLWERRSWAVSVYAWVIGGVGALLMVATLVGLMGAWPAAAPGKASLPGVWPPASLQYWLTWGALLGVAAALAWLCAAILARAERLPLVTAVVTGAIYCLLQISVLPQAMSYKTDRPAAEALLALAPAEGSPTIWQWRTDPLSRYYGLDFYSGDRTRLLPSDLAGVAPDGSDLLLLSDNELDAFLTCFATRLTLTPVAQLTERSAESKAPLRVYNVKPFLPDENQPQ